MSSLAGKIALVTGASKGIGASIAQHLATAGATVAVNYASDQAGAERVVQSIVEKGGKARAIQASVDKAEDVTRLFAEIKQAHGTLDILVNNAGVYEFAPIEAVTAESFHRMFNINVLGLLLATQEAVKLFPATGGNIINVSSLAAKGAPNASVYSATKGAVDTISAALAAELGPRNIRVNSLSPGMVETEGVHAAGFLGTDFHKQAVAATPLGRIGQPQDIAAIATFLSSADSGWITGQTILAGGGYRF
ncbi:MAG TPA: glucose 1-dehydrogenase [Granulicella sp.]